jgi:putative colanic acid biosynthesis UDP-glucose lipid carrier transferase
LRPKNAFFICPKAISEHDLQRLTQPGTRIARVDHLDDSHETPTLLRHRLSEATVWAGMDEIVIVWRDGPLAQLEAMLLELRSLPVSVKVIFDSFTGLIVAGRSESFGSATAFQVQSPPLGWAERATKRSFDIGFSLTAILCLSPMLLIVALAVKLETTGPVFFRQRRLGYANQPFRIVKFRSMSVMEDSHDVRQATKHDPRITRVGAFIRASSIDELPQFWNVLRGEMSVVGPRPHAVAHDNIYDQLIVQYASRRYVKPGLTGWAQVMGSRGETPTVEAMEQRVAHDLWYIDNWSMWLDIKIVLRTALALRGA